PLIVSRLEQVDQPIPQVELEAIICVVSPDCSSRFGVDWDHTVKMDGQTALQVGSSGMTLAGVVSGKGLRHAFDDFATTSAFVNLLAKHGYLTIRASPRVMAQDGEKATISINRESFFAIQPQGMSASNNSAFFYQQDIQKVEAGIELDITPRVRGDVVTVDIERAEVSEDIRSVQSDLAANPYPVINRRRVSTTVHVKDGKTIVIGGLTQRETVDRVNRVPGLSRLPGVGYLFKSVERQSREAEVVIFISPRIVPPTICQSCIYTSAG
ncbi:MAG: type II and III secretion system protein, partial [Planctomycetales bacterium]|nr:type II and III secretion system protein [Planctomycetales bacterium]